MPNGGQLSAGTGIQLQPTFPGVAQVGNANITGKLRAGSGAQFPAAGVPDIYNNEVIGQNTTLVSQTGAGSSRLNVLLGDGGIAYCSLMGIAGGNTFIGGNFRGGTNVVDVNRSVILGSDCSVGGVIWSSRDIVIGALSSAAGTSTIPNLIMGQAISGQVLDGVCVLNGNGHNMNGKSHVTLINDVLGQANVSPYNGNRTIIIGAGDEDIVRIGNFDLTTNSYGAVYSSITPGTIGNIAAERDLQSATGATFRGQYNNFSPKFFKVGTLINFKICGYLTSLALAVLKIRFKDGGIGAVIFGEIDATLAGYAAPVFFEVEGNFTVVTINTPNPGNADVIGQLRFKIIGTPGADQATTTSAVVSSAFLNDLRNTFEWMAADPLNTLTFTNYSLMVQR